VTSQPSRQNDPVRIPQLRSPLARAVVPVLAGLGVLAVMGALTWGSAVYIADNEEPPDQFVLMEIEVGGVERVAEGIADDGPLIFHGLGERRDRSIVLDHQAGSPVDGWKVRLAEPADRDASCGITLVRGTATFEDCEGRILEFTDLALPPDNVNPVLADNQTRLVINLRGFSPTAEATTTVGS
jgi:hypothetical protein